MMKPTLLRDPRWSMVWVILSYDEVNHRNIRTLSYHNLKTPRL